MALLFNGTYINGYLSQGAIEHYFQITLENQIRKS